jgi:uncharacterized repeat protein (TIGR01451 family)
MISTRFTFACAMKETIMKWRTLLAVGLMAMTTDLGWVRAQQGVEIEQKPLLGQRLQTWGRTLFSGTNANQDSLPVAPNGKNANTKVVTPQAGSKSMGGKTMPARDPSLASSRRGTPTFAAPGLQEPQEPGLDADRETSPPLTNHSSRKTDVAPRPAPSKGAPIVEDDSPRQLKTSPKQNFVAAPPLNSDEPSSRRSPSSERSQPNELQRMAPSSDLEPRVAKNQSLVAPADKVPAAVAQPRKLGEVSPTASARPIEPAPPANERLSMLRQGPNLAVETVGPRKISIGKEAIYTVSLANAGNSTANDVTVFVSLPAWAEVVETRSNVGSASMAADRPEAGLQWKISEVASHSQHDLTLKIVPRRSQPFDLVVRWTCAPPASQATVEVEEPKLHMDIAGPAEVLYGQQQIYRLTVSNPGTGAADDVVLHLLPVHANDGGVATHRIGTLKAGGSTTVEIELTARQAGQLAIRAEATGDGGLKSAAEALVLVRRAQLAAAVSAPKVHYAGTPITAEIVVTNTGDAAAKDVTVVALLPAGTELIAADNNGQTSERSHELQWKVEQLPAGAQQSFRCKYVLKQTGANRIETQVTAAGDLNASALASTQVLAVADLAMDVTDTPGPIPVGEAVTYTIRVRNRGTRSAEEVEVLAYFSDHLEPSGIEGGQHQASAGVVSFRPIASLAAGDETVYKVTARASKPGNHRVRVEMLCKPIGSKLTNELNTLFYAEDAAGQ